MLSVLLATLTLGGPPAHPGPPFNMQVEVEESGVLLMFNGEQQYLNELLGLPADEQTFTKRDGTTLTVAEWTCRAPPPDRDRDPNGRQVLTRGDLALLMKEDPLLAKTGNCELRVSVVRDR